MPKKPDRRSASTDVRLELRRKMLMLRDQGKTHQEIAQITGYTRTYVSTMLRRLSAAPQLLKGMSRGERPQGSLRALTAKEERRAQQLICGKLPDQLSLPFALWTRMAIRELIRREFDVRLSVRGVGEYVSTLVLHAAEVCAACLRTRRRGGEGLADDRVSEDQGAREAGKCRDQLG